MAADETCPECEGRGWDHVEGLGVVPCPECSPSEAQSHDVEVVPPAPPPKRPVWEWLPRGEA